MIQGLKDREEIEINLEYLKNKDFPGLDGDMLTISCTGILYLRRGKGSKVYYKTKEKLGKIIGIKLLYFDNSLNADISFLFFYTDTNIIPFTVDVLNNRLYDIFRDEREKTINKILEE